MLIKLICLSILAVIVSGNLEGPFLFFGPKSLDNFKRPALSYLEQDDLMRIYEGQGAIVVFNNQDSLPLSSGGFPRLRKMLEDQTVLVLPQDFLDVHPDYVSNETQVLTLEGPWSERDAQMTETFARLQDIYGKGRVLGILGNSVSQTQSADYEDWRRVKRAEAEDETSDEEAVPEPRYVLYNASSGAPGLKALMLVSSWPEIQWEDRSVTVLDTPIGEQTVKFTKMYTSMVVKFADGENTRDKITIDFWFKQSSGWWTAVAVTVTRGLMEPVHLLGPLPPAAATAAVGKSYHCSLPLVFQGNGTKLVLNHVTMQAFMESTDRFGDPFDCIGFTSVPIWSGLLVVSIMLIGLAISIIMIMDIRTMDKFETCRSKQLTITVSE